MSLVTLDLIKTLIADNLLGSIILFAVCTIALLILLILAARVSFKVGLVLIFPAILAIFGIGVNEGILGVNFRWIGVMIVVAIGITLGLVYIKMSE